MKKLREYADKPLIGPLVKKVINFTVSKQAEQISQHFSAETSHITFLLSKYRIFLLVKQIWLGMFYMYSLLVFDLEIVYQDR